MRDKILTDAELQRWTDFDDVEDSLHRHFTKLDLRDWCDVYIECRRITNLMFDEGIEPDSPRDSLIAATAAAAAHCAFAAVARSVGVPAEDMAYAVDEFYFGKKNESIGWLGLIAETASGNKFHRDLRKQYREN